MNFTYKNSRFGVIRENEPTKKHEELTRQSKKNNRNNENNSRSKKTRSINKKPALQEKLLESQIVDYGSISLTQDYYPTLEEAVTKKTPQQTPLCDDVTKEEIKWKDKIANIKETEEVLNLIQPGWVRLHIDKKTHKIIREYGPPVEDSGLHDKWNHYDHLQKLRSWLAYIEEQEEIRRELEPDYLYQREDYSESEYDTDNEDILVEEECFSDELDEDDEVYSDY